MLRIQILRATGIDWLERKLIRKLNTTAMIISGQPSPVQIMIDQKQLENVEYLNYLGSTTTNDAICSCEIKSRIAIAKAAFNKKTLFTRELDLNLRKKLVKCNTWSTAL
jgi:hypothetical protein